MASDVKVIAATTEPVDRIGLHPLNNVLVNAFLSPEAYNRNKESGTEFVPIRCGSTVEAAYLFEPSISVSPPSSVANKSDQASQDAPGATTSSSRPHVDTEAVLPEGGAEQVVEYWRRCRVEDDLAKHFEPNAVVDAMRPASLDVDRLGTLTRLRVVSATYNGLLTQVQNASPKVPSPAPTDLGAIRWEKTRLLKELLAVRQVLLQKLEQTPSIHIQDRLQSLEVDLSIRSDPSELKRHIGGPQSSKVVNLLERQLEYRRMQAVIGSLEERIREAEAHV